MTTTHADTAAPSTALTAEQWVDIFLAADREQRVRMAGSAVRNESDMAQGQACWMGDHTERLAKIERRDEAAREALTELNAALPEMSDAARPGVETVLYRMRRYFS